MRRIANLLVLLGILAVAACGSTLKATGDAGADSSVDTGVDTGSDGTVDPGTDPGDDPEPDAVPDTVEDTLPDTATDPEPDSTAPQCDDGLDNDGDDLIDMEDFDCPSPDHPVEGPPPDGCSVDNHCDAGFAECDRSSGECYEPPEGAVCEECWSSEDCGDGVTGGDPDRDWCVYTGMGGGNCTKDCAGDFDCPKGFRCSDLGEGARGCYPVVGSCDLMEVVGEGCGTDEDCYGLACEGGICTHGCEVEHDCMMGMSCVVDICVPD